MRTKAIKTKVFLEGLEVEFNSVQINETRNEPPSATVSFPADSKVLHILPRTICHVFWLDDGDDTNGTLVGDAKFRLIFQGEMTGVSITFADSRREIHLTFTGFTQNWNNNFIQSLDVNLPNMINAAAMGIDYPTEDRKVQWDSKSAAFMANSAYSPLANIGTQLSDEGTTVPEALRGMIEGFGAEGVYLRSMSEAFNIYKQLYIYDSATIKKITKNQAAASFIGSIAANVESTLPMHDGISSVLKYMGYEVQEIAAPTMVGGELYRIYVRPQCDFFPPIKCNAVFDDEIQNLSFNRNIENEPTRLIDQTYPFQGVQDNVTASLAMSVIVPAGVYVSKEVESVAKKAAEERQKNATQEENARNLAAVPGVPTTPVTPASFNITQNAEGTVKTVRPGSTYYRTLTFDQLKKYIAEAESTNNPLSTHQNTDKTQDTGLYMINDRHIGYAPGIGHDRSKLQYKIDRLLDTHGIPSSASKVDKQKALKDPEINEQVARLVFESQGIDGWATKDKVLAAYAQATGTNIIQNDSGILALTPEEQCRGINLAHRADTTGIENSYILAAINKAFNAKFVDMASAYEELGKQGITGVAQVNAALSELFKPTSDQITENLHTYHVAMALIDFYHQRHQYRVCNLTVPYSPYRLVGLPGIILTKYFAPIVGTLHSVSSMISADGNATQALTFSHSRIYASSGIINDASEVGELAPAFVPGSKYGFMDDNYPSPPFWYDDFASGDGLDNLYYQMTGRSKNDKGEEQFRGTALWYPETVAGYDAFASKAQKLYRDYQESRKTGSSNTFIHKTTRRELPTNKDVSDHWIKGTRKIEKVPMRGLDAKPFVEDRIRRVREVFDYTGTNLGKDIFVEQTFKDSGTSIIAKDNA